MELCVYKCDICGRERQSSNHWYVVRAGAAFHIYHWDYWADRMGEGSDDLSIPLKHICGQECLQRLLAPFLDSRSAPSTIPTEDKST
jgi:hypothetical protein